MVLFVGCNKDVCMDSWLGKAERFKMDVALLLL